MILKLGDRLEGPFNIEKVVNPIDYTISDAIMNVQENSAAISKRIFKICGTPRHHNRKRRSAEDQEEDEDEDEEEEEKSQPKTAGHKKKKRQKRKKKNQRTTTNEEFVFTSTARNQTSQQTTTASSHNDQVELDVRDDDSVMFIDDESSALGTENVSGKEDEDKKSAGSDETKGTKSRSKRKGSIDEGTTEMDYQHPNRHNSKKNKHNNKHKNKSGGQGSHRNKPLISQPGGQSLANLVRDIKNKVKAGRGIWSHVPHALCDHDVVQTLSAPTDIGDNCWNGSRRGHYERRGGGGGGGGGGGAKGGKSEDDDDSSASSSSYVKNDKTVAFYSRLSEVASTKRSARRRGAGSHDVVVSQQLTALRDISAKMKQAYDGIEVDWQAEAVLNDDPEPRFEARTAGGLRGGTGAGRGKGKGGGRRGGGGGGGNEVGSGDDDLQVTSGDGAGVDDEDYEFEYGSGEGWEGSAEGGRGEWSSVDSNGASSGGGDISFDPLNPLKPDISPLPGAGGHEKRERAGVGQSTGGAAGCHDGCGLRRWTAAMMMTAVMVLGAIFGV